nr:hypothetical protein [Tanacetum cinerariifolium]
MDRITTAMCEKSYGLASLARVLVEADSVKGLVDESKNLSEEEKRIKESMKPVNILVVVNDRNEGGYMNNGGRDNDVNKQYVPVRGNVKNVSNEKEGIKEDKKELGKRGNNVVNEVDFINENRDVACEIDITIDESEKLTWSKKMMDYFLAKFKDNNDKVLSHEEVLKYIMDDLQKHIVEGNKGLQKNVVKVTEQRIIDECAGKKVQSVYKNFYSQAYEKDLEKNDVKSLIRDKRINMIAIIETQLRKKSVNPVCKYLFGSYSWVSNAVHSRMGFRKLLWKNLVDHMAIIGSSP